MSFSITLYTPKHHFWKSKWDVWFFRPDQWSSGGTGFNIPFLHVVFMWGHR